MPSGTSIEADRSTEMYDVEDGVHLAAAKRFAGSSFKNLALFHYHPSQHVKRHPTNRIEADSSTEMYDVEDDVHLAAATRLARQKQCQEFGPLPL